MFQSGPRPEERPVAAILLEVPLEIDRYTLVTWAIPPERVRKLLPPGLDLDPVDIPGEGPRALLSIFAGKVRLSPFGLTIASVSQLNYRTYVRYGQERGIYFLRSLVSPSPVAAAVRGAIGFPARRGRVRVVWDRRGETKITATEVSLTLSRERAPAVLPGFRRLAAGIDFLLRPPWGFWARRSGRLGALRVSHPVPPPLSGSVDEARLPWLATSGLLSPDEAARPHSALFVNRLVMEVCLERELVLGVEPEPVLA
jgi:uncharacterized protein